MPSENNINENNPQTKRFDNIDSAVINCYRLSRARLEGFYIDFHRTYETGRFKLSAKLAWRYRAHVTDPT